MELVTPWFLAWIVVAASSWFVAARFTAAQRVTRESDRLRTAALLVPRGSLRDRLANTDGHGNINPGSNRHGNDDGNGTTVQRLSGRHAIRRNHYRFGPALSAGRRRAGGPNAEAVA